MSDVMYKMCVYITSHHPYVAGCRARLFFFATMAPKSQFVSAYGTMAVLLLKAAVSMIVQKRLDPSA